MIEKALYFDKNSQIYDDVRPGYPYEIYKIISKYKKFDKNSKILEVGAGNGISTQEIYDYWQTKMVLIEPGKNLYEILYNKFNNNKDIKIEKTMFEKFQSTFLFDAIFSATAFHWLDPTLKYKKSYNLLKNDGLLILYWNNYGIEDNKIENEIQEIYIRYGNGTQDKKNTYEKQMEKIESRKKEIEESNLFQIIEHKLLRNIKKYTAEKYIMLLKTFPDHIKMEERFFKDIEKIIKNNGDKIEVRVLVNLEIARKI